MIRAVLLLGCVLLSSVAAFPRRAQNGAPTFRPSFTETGHPSNILSSQTLLPDPRTCRDLLHTAPSLAPLPEYLSTLALRVALEEVGCPTEAHILRLQLKCSAVGMRSLRLIMTPVELLLCYFLLLHPVDTISYGKPTNVLVHPSVSLGSSDPLFCQTLLPKSLPGFTHMAPLPKFLVGLVLRNALEKAGCPASVWALQLQLYRQGGVKATQVLIHHLQELQKGGRTRRGVSVEALASALQLLAREQLGPERTRRSLPTEVCDNEREQRVHGVLQLLPQVGTLYNLGTALYYYTQNCTDKAKERGQDGAIDLGYDLLMAMAGVSGGPMGLAISAALKPALKSGAQRLIQYYYDKQKAIVPLPETSMESLRDTSDMSDLEEITTSTPLVSEAVTSAPSWGWAFFKSYGIDLGAGSVGI
ncbi:apolipoprotein F [Carlito syrichta]|uniref:Apolipoprotein F n=1 Tax=Carlito syrichta TaxID=1868482 RepID=A0A1U7T257_CARSF|nr:apolipoprotein F [Carlito syrichta]